MTIFSGSVTNIAGRFASEMAGAGSNAFTELLWCIPIVLNC